MKIDYSKVGFKAGLEIHQQLDCGKLFSRTPSLLRSEKPDYEITRKLHAIAGELGEVDEAVKHEASLKKEFVYQGYQDSISLVELDEAPPEMIDQEALKIGLEIALLLNCEIVPVSQIMRKTVIDGSNTGGFQRTVLFGRNGFVETSEGNVRIESVALEEDSCRIVEKNEKKAVYRLDRLGIPLIEIATAPDLKNAEHIKETALILGEILRACKVKRGIGTIRQDLNVSISKHPRVEIKGFQDPKIMVKTVEFEVERQMNEKNGKSEVRKTKPDGKTEFMRPMPGSARMYPETDLPLLEISREKINSIKRALPKLKKDIKEDLKQKGLGEEMIKLILKKNKIDDFKVLVSLTKDADLVAKMLVLWPKEIAKKLALDIGKVEEILHLDIFEKILEELEKGNINGGDLKEVLIRVVKGEGVENAVKIEKKDLNEVEEFVRKIVKENPGLRENAYMGMVMKEFKGEVSGKEVMEVIKKVLK